MLEPETVFFLMTGALLGGLVMGLVGFGTGLAALGFWLFVVDPALAVPLVCICSLATTVFTLKAYWHAVRWRRLVPFFAGAALSLPLGVWLLTGLDPSVFKLTMGVFLILYTLFRLLLLPELQVRNAGWPADMAVGAGGGLLAGIAAIPGPLTTVWCGLRGWTKHEQRGVYQPFNQVLLLIALAGYGMEGLLTPQLGTAALWCVPASLAGMWLGMMGYKRLDEEQFRRVVLWLLLASGIMLVVLNVLTLAAK